MILRSGNVNVVNVPHKYWKEAGWKLNDKVEVECTEDVIIIRRKKCNKKINKVILEKSNKHN